MNVADILSPDSVLCNAKARSKKHCLEILSELLVRPHPEQPVDEVFEKLIERERLGCTSLDLGVAFPHCRVDGIEHSTAAMIKLSSPAHRRHAQGTRVARESESRFIQQRALRHHARYRAARAPGPGCRGQRQLKRALRKRDG